MSSGFLIALVNMDVYNLENYNSLVLMEDSLVYCVSRSHPYASEVSSGFIAKNDTHNLYSDYGCPYRGSVCIPTMPYCFFVC